MPMDITPFVRAWAAMRRRRLAHLDCEASQRDTLARLVGQGARTRFGRDHHFDRIASIADYQAAVPLRSYEEFWSEYWQEGFPRLIDCTWPGSIAFFALSSGTTSGRTKYIPVTDAMRRSNTRAGLDVIARHLAACPRSRPFAGKSFMLGGSTDLKELAPGIFAGDLSGIAAKTMPLWVRPFSFPQGDLTFLTDWEDKIERLAQASLKEDIRVLTGTPSWLIILLERVAALGGGPPYPDLDLLVHGGVSFRPYHHRFAELLAGTLAEFREVYPASEGFIASADRNYGEGLAMNIDHGLFYEFVPVEELGAANPRRHWVGNAETGVDYALVLTTCAGLWSYVLGDTVRLVNTRPPRLLVTGRTSYGLSAFGEHLIGEEIEAAVSFAAEGICADVTDFMVGPAFPDDPDRRGRHRWLIEFASPPSPSAVTSLKAEIDQHLCKLNDDYRVHRTGNVQLGEPEIVVLPAGSFAAWMKSRGRLGGQNKVPRVIADPEQFAAVSAFFESAKMSPGRR